MALTRDQMMKSLLPGLNNLFGLEYEGEDYVSQFSSWPENEMYKDWLDCGWGNPGVYTRETIAMGYTITEELVEHNLYDALSERYTLALAASLNRAKEDRLK
jgi:hypothetical protein